MKTRDLFRSLPRIALTALLLGMLGCTQPAQKTDQSPAAVETPSPTWSRPDTATDAAPTAGAVPGKNTRKPAEPDIAVANPANPQEGQERQRQLQLDAGEEALNDDEVGYYMDTQEARLIQVLRDSPITMRRELNRITLVIPGTETFDSNRSRLKQAAVDALGPVAAVLEEYDATRIAINGHTDDKGEEVYNQRLSEQRALSVGRFLAASGVARARLLITGYGEAQPIATGNTPEADAANRRIELIIEPLSPN